MVIIILAAILVLAIAFYQVVQGLFSSLIMAILTILSAAIAFMFYEPLAAMVYHRMPAYADAAALAVLFIVPLIVMRILIDRLLRGNVAMGSGKGVLGVWIDRICAAALGIVSGMVLVGMLTIILQMLPFGATVLTYEPYDASLHRKHQLAPFYADEFTVALIGKLSDGALAGEQSFDREHDDLLLELFCWRNTADKGGRVEAPLNSMKVLGAYSIIEGDEQDKDEPWDRNPTAPPNPLMDPKAPSKLLIVRVAVNEIARDEHNWFLLPATQFRLVCKDGRSFYPVGYLTYDEVHPRTKAMVARKWACHGAERDENGLLQITKLIVGRQWKNAPKELVVDWVYRIPDGAEADYVVFRRHVGDKVKKATKGMPPTDGALGRMSEPVRRRGRRNR